MVSVEFLRTVGKDVKTFFFKNLLFISGNFFKGSSEFLMILQKGTSQKIIIYSGLL